MPEERRFGKRAPISAVRVTYEGASGARIEADVVDLGAGGVFIRTDEPMAVGKRIALDLHILGESGPSSALGRVIWSRPIAEDGRPPGMGVKLIDIDDATVGVIERLVETRELTVIGMGSAGSVVAEPRERTLLGVGAEPLEGALVETAMDLPPPAEEIHKEPDPPAAIPVPTAPELIPEVAASDILIASAGLPRERSVAINVTAAPQPPPIPSRRPSVPSRPPSVAPRADAASTRMVVIGLLLLIAGIAAYVLFDGFLRPMGR
jgi:uncharacterized protein (TIGR02266 family)